MTRRDRHRDQVDQRTERPSAPPASEATTRRDRHRDQVDQRTERPSAPPAGEARTQHGRRGRWRSGAESRQRILAAARALFGQHGYGGTTVRAVAAEAGVDPAMVFYFFGTKQGLFGAALDMSARLPPAIEAMFAGGLDGLGERIVRTLLENLDRSDRTPLAMLTRSAPTDDRSEALLREFIDREITARLAAMLDTPDAVARAAMVNVQILGLAVARYIARIEPIASAPVDELVARFGPLVQHCLTGPSNPS